MSGNPPERRRLEETLRLYEQVFNSADVALSILKLENPADARSLRVIAVSPAAAKITGKAPEDLIGRTLAEILPNFFVTGLLEDYAEVARTDRPKEWVEIRYGDELTPQGVFALKAFPLSNQRVGIAFENITARKEGEEALEKAKEELALRVQEHMAELSRANEELQGEITERMRAEEQLQVLLTQLRALTARLHLAREEERTHVAREIHDELGQACTALKMDVMWLVQRFPKDRTELHARAESMLKLIDTTIQSIRRIASELRPRTLDDLGLQAALECQAQEFEARTGIKCYISLSEEELALDYERSTAIFRIFQETLTNVARHADATRVDVRLQKEGPVLTLEVRDNGRGIDEAQASVAKSLGLLGMRERALLVGGELKITGAAGKGTTVSVRVPLAG